MIKTLTHAHLSRRDRIGRLYLNNTEVGAVSLLGHSGSWVFGEFIPSPGFFAFAQVYTRWSLLIHAESGRKRLNESASRKLRACEHEMDAIRASLLLDTPEEWRQCRQLNIEGSLIECKE
jgi:hypothetical protein